MSNAITEKLFDILYPKGLVCASCGSEAATGDHGLCDDCLMGVEVFNAAPQLKNIAGYTAAFVYNDVSGRMVKRLKYSGARHLAPILAEAMELPKDWQIDAVVPVPLHKHRVRERGFNQSELIAEYLCKRTGLPLDTGLLVRKLDTAHQTGLSGAQRRRMLKAAFKADDACSGLSILLVDDVRTTGTTLTECAGELLRHGAKCVYAATLCCSQFEANGILL